MKRPKQPATIGARAVRYLAVSMALPKAETEQHANWVLGHVMTFALRELAAERRRIRRELLAVGTIPEGKWVYRAGVVEAIETATKAPSRKTRQRKDSSQCK